MGCTVEEKKDTVVKTALKATEQNFTSSKGSDHCLSDQAGAEVISEASAKVYFQIED